MAERHLFPQWQNQNEDTKYPFSSRASLTNAAGVLLTEGTLLDAALYPIGAVSSLYLASVVVTNTTVTLWLGDDQNPQLASGSFPVASPPAQIVLLDTYGRPAGVLISAPLRLGIFATWGAGTFNFTAANTQFAATVCFPTPAIGVQGVQLPDGTLLTGPVWLVGGSGVMLRRVPGAVATIRVDIVGDPLFKRTLCQPMSLFVTPNFIKTITFVDAKQTVICHPDAYGDIQVGVNNALAQDTVLRVHPTPQGVMIDAVGSTIS